MALTELIKVIKISSKVTDSIFESYKDFSLGCNEIKFKEFKMSPKFVSYRCF